MRITLEQQEKINETLTNIVVIIVIFIVCGILWCIS